MQPEQTKKVRKWYQKKRYIIPLGIVTLVALANSGEKTPTPSPTVPVVHQQTVTIPPPVSATPAQKTVAPTPQPTSSTSTGLSNNNYYTNVDGNTVHSPAYSSSVPAGASAQCRDGTYSFSQHRQGTCSHHGGVARWL